MKTIHKYLLTVTDRQAVRMPQGAEFLSVQMQHGNVYVWALVDDSAPQKERMLEIFGTGHPIYEDMGVDRKYVGTFQMDGGHLVFHLFERLP